MLGTDREIASRYPRRLQELIGYSMYRNVMAFLHVLETNENALRLYHTLGFEIRRLVQAVVMVRLPDDASRKPPGRG